jgi:hypothetical protein
MSEGKNIGLIEAQNPSFQVTSTKPVRKAIPEEDAVYFITFACSNWLPLFKLCNAYNAPRPVSVVTNRDSIYAINIISVIEFVGHKTNEGCVWTT